jgi:uncharacterized protein
MHLIMSLRTHRPPQYKLKPRRSSAGLGLFALDDIPKGRFLIEYTGKLMVDDEAQEIGGRYLFEIGNGKTVEGSTRANIARYINHACRPNCEIRTRGNLVEIWSTKHIKAGKEINYDYGKEYWEHYIEPLGCRCDSCALGRKSKN